jgi:hypothetical protein
MVLYLHRNDLAVFSVQRDARVDATKKVNIKPRSHWPRRPFSGVVGRMVPIQHESMNSTASKLGRRVSQI